MTGVDQRLLARNVGSATLKAALFLRPGEGLPYVPAERAAFAVGDPDVRDDEHRLAQVLARLPAEASQPDVIVHRVVHGGRRRAPTVLDDAVVDELRALSPLAPLHQGPALSLIDAARRRWPQVRQIAAFDTAWHANLAPWSRRLPLPQDLHDAGVVRFGFHGLAFRSVMRRLTQQSPRLARGRLVLAHLGGGSSLCAVADGTSLDTTMGVTPLDGVPMATRSGALDPGVMLYLAGTLNLPLARIEQMLWRDAGLRGISGLSGDMRELLADSGAAAALALDQYTVRVAQAIAAMATAIGGMDGIVFSGGIGEGAAPIRSRVAGQLQWTGLRLDPMANRNGGPAIHANDSAIAVWVLGVDEELELAIAARDCESA
mgnify:CR=1 FL=1